MLQPANRLTLIDAMRPPAGFGLVSAMAVTCVSERPVATRNQSVAVDSPFSSITTTSAALRSKSASTARRSCGGRSRVSGATAASLIRRVGACVERVRRVPCCGRCMREGEPLMAPAFVAFFMLARRACVADRDVGMAIPVEVGEI